MIDIRLVLASFFQEEFHGPGRKIGIVPSKPAVIADCYLVARWLSPEGLYWEYHNNKKAGNEKAGEIFTAAYKEKLDSLVQEIKEEAEKTNKSVFDVLPFMDGDTLLSWEKKENISYRPIVAEYLRQLGYEVIEN